MSTEKPKSYRWAIILAALIIAAAILINGLLNNASFQSGVNSSLNQSGVLATYQAVQTMTAELDK